MLAIAVSPPCMSSTASTMPGSTQPVPVVVATTSTARSHASVRSSSATTRSAVASRSPSGSSPAYARTGSRTSAGSTTPHDAADEDAEPPRDPAQAATRLEHEERDGERDGERRDLAAGDVLRHAEQVPQLDLATGAEHERERDEHDGGARERPPRDPARARGPPDPQPDPQREPLDERAEPVPPDGAHARDHGLVVPRARDERGREGQAEPGEREHEAGRREPSQPPAPGGAGLVRRAWAGTGGGGLRTGRDGRAVDGGGVCRGSRRVGLHVEIVGAARPRA